MRCTYMSDLHLESQDFHWPVPEGDIAIVAGDLCHACCLDPHRADRYAQAHRDRVLRFMDALVSRFAHVLMVAGNHEHYDGVLEDTASTLRRHLPAVTLLDRESTTIGGVRFFGTTLWSDFDNRSAATMMAVRRRMGEYFFVKRRLADATLRKLTPADTLAEFDAAWSALKADLDDAPDTPTVVVTHHAPSLKGCNPRYAGNGLDGAYASTLDAEIAGLGNVKAWVHGHTHIQCRYAIGAVPVYVNCRGFDGKDGNAGFAPARHFEIG